MCDGWVTLDSNNFDQWGLTWNLEANLEVDDPGFTEVVSQMFEHDFAQCTQITLEGWHHRTWHQRLAEWLWGKVDKLVAQVTSRLRRHR